MIENPFDTQLGYPRFVGRTATPDTVGNCELHELRQLVVAAKHGNGRLVIVEGEAGVGKTRLLRQLTSELRADCPLAGEKKETFAKPPVPAVLLTAADWKDRQEMVDALILDLAEQLEGTKAKISKDLPEGVEHWSASFNKGIDYVLEKLAVPAGIVAGTAGLPVVLGFGASYVGVKLLQGLLTRVKEMGVEAPQAWPQVLRMLRRVNEVFAKCQSALVICIDQWDDLAELELHARREFITLLRGAARTIEELNPCHLLLLIGGRSGRINTCTAGLGLLDKLPVNRLPISEVRDLLRHPRGVGNLQGPRFSDQATDAFLSSCYGPDHLPMHGNMALVQLGAKLVCDTAIQSGVDVITLEQPPGCIQGSMEQVVEGQIVGFRSGRDDRAASEFLLALGTVAYSGFTADQLRALMTEDQQNLPVGRWLQEFSADTGLLNIKVQPTGTYYSFAHHVHQTVLRDVVSDEGQEGQRWRDIAQAAVSAVVVGNPAGVPESLSDIPGTAWIGPLRDFAMRILSYGEDTDRDHLLAVLLALSRVAKNMASVDSDYHNAATSVMSKGTKHPDSDVRQAAAEALGEVGDEAGTSSLLACLKDSSAYVRRGAARALGMIKSEGAVGALVDALIAETDWYARLGVTDALQEIGMEKAAGYFQTRLEHEDARTRQIAALGLVEGIGEVLEGDLRAKVIDELVQGMGSADSDIRESSAEGLGHLKAREGFAALLQGLKDPERDVRQAAAAALGEVGDAAATSPLLRCLRDSSEFVRREAAEALGKIKSEEAVEALVDALTAEADRYARSGMTKALQEIGLKRAAGHFQARLEHEDPRIRQIAALGLAEGMGEVLEGDLRAKVIDELIQAMGSADSEIRESSAEGLGHLKAREGFAALLQGLKDPERDVRQAAAAALGEVGDEAATSGLLGSLKDNSEFVRREAAEALGKIKSEEAVEALVDALIAETDWYARGGITYALQEIGLQIANSHFQARLQHEDPRTRQVAALGLAEGMGEVLEVDLRDRVISELVQGMVSADKDTRKNSAEGLGHLKAREGFEALLQGLKDPERDMRQAAAAALGEVGDEAATSPLLGCLKDNSEFVRREAAEALGKIKSESAVEALVDALIAETDSYARSGITHALQEIGMERTSGHFQTRLGHEDARTRQIAALGLAEGMGEVLEGDLRAKVIDELIQGMGSADSDIRESSAEGLGHLRAREGFEALLQGLKDPERDVRQAAAAALGEIGDEAATSSLLGSLKDNSEYVRREAAEALGKIKSEEAVEALVDSLIAETDPFARGGITDALQEIGLEKAAGYFQTRLEDEDPRIRQIAALGLAEGMGEELEGDLRVKVIDELVQSMGSADNDIRESSAQGLGHLRAREGLDALLQGLKDPERDMRQAAAAALGEVGDEAATGSLLGALKDSSEYVRREAAEALGKIKSEEAVEALVDALIAEADPYARSGITDALQEIGMKKAAGCFQIRLGDEDPRTRQIAALGLAEGMGEVLEGDLRETVVGESILGMQSADKDVRVASAEALGQLKSQKGVESLLRGLGDPRADVRKAAAEALEELRMPELAGYLEPMFGDPVEQVRVAASIATILANPVRAADLLVSERLPISFGFERYLLALNLCSLPADAVLHLFGKGVTESGVMLAAAIAAKTELTGAVHRVTYLVQDFLMRILREDNEQYAAQAIAALACLPLPLVDSKRLSQYLLHPSMPVRIGAISALSRARGEWLANRLMGRYQYESASVRETIVESLGSWPNPTTVAFLQSLLEGPGSSVLHAQARLSLIRIGSPLVDPNAVKDLSVQLGQHLSEKRFTASSGIVRSIRIHEQEEFKDLIYTLLQDPSPDTRCEACVALVRFGDSLKSVLGQCQSPNERTSGGARIREKVEWAFHAPPEEPRPVNG